MTHTSSSSSLEDEILVPPQPRFITDTAVNHDREASFSSSHSRTNSGIPSSIDSPQAQANPFSPVGSVTSLGVPDTSSDSTSPRTPPIQQHTHALSSDSVLSVPRSGILSNSASVQDFARGPYSVYGSSRPGTADYSMHRPGTGDYSTRPGTADRPSSIRFRETFASPKPRPLTVYSTAQLAPPKAQRERPKSTMLSARGPIEKPWTTARDPYARIAYFSTYAMVVLGVALGALRCWLSWVDTPVLPNNMCLVMDENFDSEEGLFGENGKFFREVDMSGFGNGEFEMTTASENNSYVRNGRLYITPTLTSDAIGADAIVDGHIFNITDCTFNITQGLSYTAKTEQLPNNSTIGADQAFNAEGYYRACSAVSNVTSGQVINPVQSARLSTRRTASIKYGRVEVRAKIPKGDWFWPAIWMLPVDNKYGPWPLSGEIDIMESRGNGIRYPFQGSNVVRGSLNWGPAPWLNRVWKTYGWWTQRRESYGDDFHTYALEWTEDFMRIYVDTRLHHLMDLRIKQSFWDRGDFPLVVQNGSEAVILDNPWRDGSKAAPFDQPFYLILNVAVGGTNGWFPDGSGKPWFDGSKTAMGEFWHAKDQWLPTWSDDPEDRSLVVDSIKMWKFC